MQQRSKQNKNRTKTTKKAKLKKSLNLQIKKAHLIVTQTTYRAFLGSPAIRTLPVSVFPSLVREQKSHMLWGKKILRVTRKYPA